MSTVKTFSKNYTISWWFLFWAMIDALGFKIFSSECFFVMCLFKWDIIKIFVLIKQTRSGLYFCVWVYEWVNGHKLFMLCHNWQSYNLQKNILNYYWFTKYNIWTLFGFVQCILGSIYSMSMDISTNVQCRLL